VTIVGITGHQGLPPEAATLVVEKLPELLAQLGASSVLGSLAEGADQLCARVALSQGIPVRAIIPCVGYESTFSGKSLRAYQALLHEASSTQVLDFPEPSEAAFFAAGVRVVEEADTLIAIWDGQPAAGKGGTGDIVNVARAASKTVKVLWPPGVER
jgi:hypothetical protein